MEVDSIETWNSNPSDGEKFTNMKAFVAAAREFETTHSENAVNLMTRYLGLIASSCDLSIFSPGRSEVCAFFSSLWRVMSHGRGPHWAGVAVLARASMDASAREALTHTYKFMPILSRLLSDSISNDKKIKLLSVMQDISYGIKISWQESYLPGLIKLLTDWITQPMVEPQLRTIGQRSLTVLVNVCYGNLPAIYTLMRTVDTKEFVVHLISLKDGGYGGVEVCRLLLCLSGATRGSAATRQADVHSYLCCTMRTFKKAVVERDGTQLRHACAFVHEMCTAEHLRGHVITYQHLAHQLSDALKDVEDLCTRAAEDAAEPGNSAGCLKNALKFATSLVHLDVYSLRGTHTQLMSVCMKSSRVCLPETLQLFAAIVSQYKEDGRLPQELLSCISDGLPALLVPPALEPGKAGLQWLQVVNALCDSPETQERVLQLVTPDQFEDTVYAVLEHTAMGGHVRAESGQQAAAAGTACALSLAPLSGAWQDALHRVLTHHQVKKHLCAGLTSGDAARRRQILQLVKHHYFPSDLMNQVFSESVSGVDAPAHVVGTSAVDSDASSCDMQPTAATPVRDRAVDTLIATLTQAHADNKLCDVATSSVMELYGYKMTCLEQRLHSYSVALQGATDHMASLQHTLAMLQATNCQQQDVLYNTQMINEKHKSTIDSLHKQLEDAETTLRGFRAKLAAERMDKEHQKDNLQKEFNKQLQSIESECRAREKESENRLKQAETDNKTLLKKLDQQTSKNSELASVLVKFEERVKQRDRRLEDATAAEHALRRDLEHRDATIKQLEKTVLERENRLYQVTTQLEEMKRVQEMVAKLMTKSTANVAS